MMKDRYTLYESQTRYTYLICSSAYCALIIGDKRQTITTQFEMEHGVLPIPIEWSCTGINDKINAPFLGTHVPTQESCDQPQGLTPIEHTLQSTKQNKALSHTNMCVVALQQALTLSRTTKTEPTQSSIRRRILHSLTTLNLRNVTKE